MLQKLIHLVGQKNSIDQWQEWYNGSITYFEALKEETNEVAEELKSNNSVYLEDELWDILWCYLNLIKWLESEWKITSLEKILERAETKYSWRVNAVEWWQTQDLRSANWLRVKNEQKAELLKEHLDMYGDKW